MDFDGVLLSTMVVHSDTKGGTDVDDVTLRQNTSSEHCATRISIDSWMANFGFLRCVWLVARSDEQTSDSPLSVRFRDMSFVDYLTHKACPTIFTINITADTKPFNTVGIYLYIPGAKKTPTGAATSATRPAGDQLDGLRHHGQKPNVNEETDNRYQTNQVEANQDHSVHKLAPLLSAWRRMQVVVYYAPPPPQPNFVSY